MAKQNKLKLAISLVEVDIARTEELLDVEASSGNYRNAEKLSWVIEGLEKNSVLSESC